MASNNSSKTAHVMNLLSKNRPAEPAPEATETAASAPESAAPESAPTPAAPQAPILASINEDAAVSSQIKDALEAELSEEAPAAEPDSFASDETEFFDDSTELTAETQIAAALEAEASSDDDKAEMQIAAALEAEASSDDDKAETQAAAALEAEASSDDDKAETQARFAARAAQLDDNSYVNVMHILVDEKADKYMEMFGLCCCDRCKADVRAYALNHLPPKYVFMGRSEMVPRLTVYESKFGSEIVAQLLNACRVVLETPHHTR